MTNVIHYVILNIISGEENMQEEIRIWQILENDDFKELEGSEVNFESRLEKLILKDIRFISDDLLFLGSQVRTDFQGIIDILCIDSQANLVVIELKRDRVSRETVAQALDYSSWVSDLDYESIVNIFNSYNNTEDHQAFEEAFKSKFGDMLPEKVNENHKMLVVGSNMDQSTERIIRYLNQRHGVDINSIKFKLFKDAQGNELLSRNFLIELDEAEERVLRKTGKSRPLYDENKLMAYIEENPDDPVNKIIKEIYQWSKEHNDLSLEWSMMGKDRGVLFYPVLELDGINGILFAVDKHTIRLWFQYYGRMLSDAVRESCIKELVSDLNQIEGITINRYHGRPDFSLATLTNDESKTKFFEIFEKFIRKVKAEQV